MRELVRDWGASSPELIEEMIVTALKIARDRMSMADLKLINRSVKEMRYAAKVFAPFQNLRKVAVFGSARTLPNAPEFKVAEDLTRLTRHRSDETNSAVRDDGIARLDSVTTRAFFCWINARSTSSFACIMPLK